jgi:hypothetical protein
LPTGVGDRGALLRVVHEGFERGEVLTAEIVDERGEGIVFALFGAVGGLDEAIGDAAHCGDDDHDGALREGGFNDCGGAAYAVGIADGGAAEFHDAE